MLDSILVRDKTKQGFSASRGSSRSIFQPVGGNPTRLPKEIETICSCVRVEESR